MGTGDSLPESPGEHDGRLFGGNPPPDRESPDREYGDEDKIREAELSGGNKPGPIEAKFRNCAICDTIDLQEDMVNQNGSWICLHCSAISKEALSTMLIEEIETTKQLRWIIAQKDKKIDNLMMG